MSSNSFIFPKNIVLISMSFFIVHNGFALEIGDKFELRRRVIGEDRIIVKRFNAEITDYNKDKKSVYMKSETYYPDDYRYKFEGWYSTNNFPSNEDIDTLLKNCETLGWKESRLEFLDPDTGKKNLKEVCVTTKELFKTTPFHWEADIYYYGHFPVYGIGKMEYVGRPREVYYLKNLIFN